MSVDGGDVIVPSVFPLRPSWPRRELVGDKTKLLCELCKRPTGSLPRPWLALSVFGPGCPFARSLALRSQTQRSRSRGAPCVSMLHSTGSCARGLRRGLCRPLRQPNGQFQPLSAYWLAIEVSIPLLKLCVGDLPFAVDKSVIRELFEPHGTAMSYNMIND